MDHPTPASVAKEAIASRDPLAMAIPAAHRVISTLVDYYAQIIRAHETAIMREASLRSAAEHELKIAKERLELQAEEIDRLNRDLRMSEERLDAYCDETTKGTTETKTAQLRDLGEHP